MITLTQHVPKWCNDFAPGSFDFDSKESFEKLPLVEYFLSSFGAIGYKGVNLYFNSNEIGLIFKKDAPLPHEVFIMLGTVEDVEGAEKIFNA